VITGRNVVGAGIFVLGALMLAAWIASGREVPTPIWSSNPSGLLFCPVFFGARLGWDQRRRGAIRIVAGIVGGIAFALACFLAFDAVVSVLHPWARDQAWIGSAGLVLLVATALALLMRHIVVQTNAGRRRIALAQAGVIATIAFGLWLGTRWWEGTSGFGLLLALIGVFAAYGLEKVRVNGADSSQPPVDPQDAARRQLNRAE
jgi:hypothetical protein